MRPIICRAKVDTREGRHSRSQPAITVLDYQLDAIGSLIELILFALTAHLRDPTPEASIGERGSLQAHGITDSHIADLPL
jgi:hypothetical protein